MPTITPGAGTKLYVCPDAPASIDASDYAALSWTLVEGVDAIPDIGPSRTTITFDDLGSGTILKSRGSEDPGEPSLSLADDPTDPGQVLLKAAYDAASGTAAETVSIRIVDAAAKVTYAQSKVSAWQANYGGSNEIIRRNTTLLITSGTFA